MAYKSIITFINENKRLFYCIEEKLREAKEEKARECRQIEKYKWEMKKYGGKREHSRVKNTSEHVAQEIKELGGIHLVCSHEFVAVPHASLLPSPTLHM